MLLSELFLKKNRLKHSFLLYIKKGALTPLFRTVGIVRHVIFYYQFLFYANKYKKERFFVCFSHVITRIGASYRFLMTDGFCTTPSMV